jgi:hypothetical protein
MATGVHDCQQPFWRISLAGKGIGPGVQGCLPGLWPATEGNHLQAGAEIMKQWQQGNTWQPGQFPIEQDQIGTHHLHPIQQAGAIDCLTYDFDLRLVHQQQPQR